MTRKRPPPPLNQIRSFECAARHLSFTAAADELGFTQAAISMHVRSLETYIGLPLFLRSARSLSLTETGEAFLPTLRQALRQIDNATETILSSARSQTVIISAPMSFSENRLIQALGGFQEVHPEVDIVIHGTIWESEPDSVADIIISINRDDDAPKGSDLLCPEQLVLLCAPSIAERISRPADLMDIPRIHVLGRHDFWDTYILALGLETMDHDRGFRTNASNVALEMAATGMGLVVTLHSLAQIYIERNLLVAPLPHYPLSNWGYYIASSESKKNKATAKVFDWLMAGAGADA
ncbi:LysR substrate-binding domain-containing protein [Roseovarius aestuarii]|nr:LysR substrate-binding domain-containing protein [Roseovarius aestuarii]